MPIDTRVAQSFLETDFEKKLFNASVAYIFQPNDPLRFNSFAASMREIFRHVLARLSPDQNIIQCSWFTSETQTGSPSRRQRIIYAIRGGLNEDFLKNELDIELENELTEIIKSINLLSKYTHVNKNTFDLDQVKCEEYSKNVIDSFITIFELIFDIRNELKNALRDYIGDGVLYTFLGKVFDNLDILSMNTTTEYSELESFEILNIDNESIHIHGCGYVHVSLNYGSGDDGTELTSSFPFDLQCYSQVSSTKDLEIQQGNIHVDTSSWYE